MLRMALLLACARTARSYGLRTTCASAPRFAAARSHIAHMTVATAAEPMPTLDERYVSESPEAVKRALSMRRAASEQLDAVDRIGELTRQRAELVVEGNSAREIRKKLSPKIGAFMKNGETEEADKLKAEVAAAAASADAADERMAAVEAERSALFNSLPNLLDPRVDDGDDEEQNVEVSSWGCEGELPKDLRWHDDVGTALGGLDLDAASRLSGSRFAVLRGQLARLERALANFFLDMHTEKVAAQARTHAAT